MRFKGLYWLYFEFYVYIRLTEKKVLLLNTLDNTRIVSDDPQILSLFAKILEQKENGGCEIDFDNIYIDEVYQAFFNKVRNKYMGDLIKKELVEEYPFQFPMEAKVNNDFRKSNNAKWIDNDFLQKSLFSLNLILNNKCFNECENCSKYYKQFLCCSKYFPGDSLPVKYVESVLRDNEFCNLLKINILGGDVSLYEDFDDLLCVLSKFRTKCYLYCNYLNIHLLDSEIWKFFENRIMMIIDMDLIDKNNIEEIKSYSRKCHLLFVVKNARDYNSVCRYTDDIDQSFFDLIPFYDGSNIDFFKKYVFVNEKDLFSNLYSVEQIYKKQLLNELFFGELIVFPNGDISSGVNEKMLGNLKDEAILNILKKELERPDSLWFKSRNKTSCSTCLYVDLCPSVSNYEFVMDKMDLCKMK